MRSRFDKVALSILYSWVLVAIGLSPGTTISAANDLSVRTVDDYVFGGYKGAFVSPPSADGDPRRAVIVQWQGRPERFVFWHEASYCPFFELSDGSGACFQFFEGNDGWAELFNQFGRMEKNSFVEIVDRGPRLVHVRWTYFGVNQQRGERAYRAVEDFYCLANGLVLRRQAYQSLMPKRNEGYAREPIELIGMCPVGKLWKDVLKAGPPLPLREGRGAGESVRSNTPSPNPLPKGEGYGERHALTALDPFSDKRYDVYWRPKENTLWQATARREGCAWKEIDDAAGVVLVLPMRAGSPFCAFGTASGFAARTTRIKEHSDKDTGGVGWVSSCWDHWPIGWLNSQGHEVDAASLKEYPNHFSPAGMDFFAVPNEDVARGEYWSLVGARGDHTEKIRNTVRQWLQLGPQACRDPVKAERLPSCK
jgi:hypothetical protein